ncbi:MULTISPECIES: cytochrome c oxidase subunit 3 [Inquilinus]|jgi:cytochrome c oxidase subunit 3|uniref:Cytochrome c oxidase subunit 3 n=1 Tax=Inquilinus ginsengisoli TaxID=363840 RepID=A0ABU1JMI2_9PROT|nr:cytochrome c oxidase subunit 3 [Inquilinus ginsengisoli]MDR6289826.1 cytochrome c oxidase subunit 3 [Inquilinus ginsengisoli]
MVIIILFMTGAVAAALWWLSRQGLMTKPWLEQSTVGDVPATGASSLPAAKIGLGMFLTVAGSLFALLVSAYAMRMAMPDWRALPMPILLWINTGALVVSSAALQCAQGAARRQDLADVRTGLLAGGAGALVFLAGQLLAWQQLNALGYFLATNPANAFFYLLTAVHGVHVAGGMVALGRTGTRAWRGDRPDRLRLSVELCTMYWHFLLLVWLVLLGLLMGWADRFADMCRQLLS